MSKTREKYGLTWPTENDDLLIELWMIRKGDDWLKKNGRSLSFHYEEAKKILWPELDPHRWHNLCRDSILENKVCVLMGCGSSGKTNAAAWISLLDYFAFPKETCVLVCSTDVRGLKKRVWGEVTMLWEKAIQKFDYLPGNLLDSAIAITTESMEDLEYGERKSRDMRQGIFGIPCVQGGKFVGLSKFIGVKQKRMRLVADEASAMNDSFLSSFSNLNKNEDFRAIVLGNPNDIHDPLGKAAEPLGGWTDEYLEPTKTRTWKTRFMNGLCVNLVGIDSPNNDLPPDQPTKYKYLISKEKIDETLSFFSKDSVEYYSQCVGTMKIGTMARRILTRELCERFGAQTQAIWKNDKRTKVYFLDASYGGDRAVCGGAEFGEDVNGKIVISFYPQKIIPVVVGGENVEDQLAKFVKQDCEALGISPSNMGHDATGRGSLGTALARIWSADTNPIESGGVPSDRPVSLDLFTTDEATGQRRLKLCKEFYDRKVSEFWFCVRYAVEAGQIRDLPEDAMDELCARKWDILKNGLHSVEVKDGTRTKPGMKQRTGKSPDHGDCAAGVIEMARRKGFQISKLAMEDKKTFGKNWMEQDMKKSMKLINERQLQSV
jgi:hypothetical protein